MNFFKENKRLVSGLVALFLLTTGFYLYYSYKEPDTFLGEIYLKFLYSPKIYRLKNIHQYVSDVNGGVVTDKFRIFLLKELDYYNHDSEEARNIRFFFAIERQYYDFNSPEGKIVKESLPEMVDLAIKDESDWLKDRVVCNYLLLATGRGCYKNFYNIPKTPHEALLLIKENRVSEIKMYDPFY